MQTGQEGNETGNSIELIMIPRLGLALLKLTPVATLTVVD